MVTDLSRSSTNDQLNLIKNIVSEDNVANLNKMSRTMFCRTHCSNTVLQWLRTFTFRFLTVSSTATLIIILLLWFYGGVCLLILLHIAVLGILYDAQDLLLYYPEQPSSSRLFVDLPTAYGLAYETVNIRSHDGTQIHAQFVSHSMSSFNISSPTIVFFHGNAGNIGHRLPNVQALCLYNRVNVLLVEYRGFGKSQGIPSEEGLYQDARAALDYIFSRTDINQQKIMVFGRSLGGAVALNVASDPRYASRIAAVLVENTFTSIPEMARALFNVSVLHYLPEWCFKNKFISRSLVHKINIPALFICGLQDSLVPPRMMHQLYESCGSRLKRLALFADGTHNDTWQSPGYYEAINRYFAELDESHKGLQVASSSTYLGTEGASMFNDHTHHASFM